MKKHLVFLAIAAIVYACGGSDAAETVQSSSTTVKKDDVDGEKIYKQYCVTCHGLYGDMGASGAFNLQESELSLEERIGIVANGREGTAMVGFKTLLSEEKIAAAAKHTMTLKAQE